MHLAAATSKSTPLQRLDARVVLDQAADLEDLARSRPSITPTISGRRVRWAISSPVSTFSAVPPQTGSSCSTESTPSKPPS